MASLDACYTDAIRIAKSAFGKRKDVQFFDTRAEGGGWRQISYGNTLIFIRWDTAWGYGWKDRCSTLA